MKLEEARQSALELRTLFEEFEMRRFGRCWSTAEIALGFVGDVGDLAKLIQAVSGVRDIPDAAAKLEHELADCLWSILVLADKLGVDLEDAFERTMTDLKRRLRDELSN
jgi:NTP pyrophosphatase (non-canonical NTP hydrolase)